MRQPGNQSNSLPTAIDMCSDYFALQKLAIHREAFRKDFFSLLPVQSGTLVRAWVQTNIPRCEGDIYRNYRKAPVFTGADTMLKQIGFLEILALKKRINVTLGLLSITACRRD